MENEKGGFSQEFVRIRIRYNQTTWAILPALSEQIIILPSHNDNTCVVDAGWIGLGLSV